MTSGPIDDATLVLIGATLGQDVTTSGTVIVMVTVRRPLLSGDPWNEASLPHGAGE